ncbi:MAG: nicotinate-nicotinamide nucleotide adenylyltransferase [Bacilli bacterium]|nr:nicotinate-nicotinamide nucleotide adenylyltransferase [Bacilli bacterium]
MSKQKTVILSGSFNPPTLAHIELLLNSIKAVGADKGLFLPCSHSYLKSKNTMHRDGLALKDEVRLKMLSSIHEEYPQLDIIDYEITGKGTSFSTYSSLSYYQNEHQDEELFYICGADKLSSLPHWHKIENFIKEFNIIIFRRDGTDIEKEISKVPLFKENRTHFYITPSLENVGHISSTKIRNLFKNGDPKYLDYLSTGVGNIMKDIKLSDYPEVSMEEWVSFMLKHGGRLSKNKVSKAIFADNSRIFLENKQKFLSFEPAKYYASPFDYSPKKIAPSTSINVLNMNLDEALKPFKEKYEHLAIFNNTHPARVAGYYDEGKGSGYDTYLSLRSNLSLYLYQYAKPTLKRVKMSGVSLIKDVYPLNKGSGLYAKDVIFFRYGENNDYRLRDEVLSDVISIPLSDESQIDNQIRLLYKVASMNKVECLIIDKESLKRSAIGMNEALKRFKTILLEEFNGILKEVVILSNSAKKKESKDQMIRLLS